MIDVLQVLVSDYWPDTVPERRRELELIRARFAGGESVERLAADYRVPPEAIAPGRRQNRSQMLSPLPSAFQPPSI